jgi:hypothetical protein
LIESSSGRNSRSRLVAGRGDVQRTAVAQSAAGTGAVHTPVIGRSVGGRRR